MRIIILTKTKGDESQRKRLHFLLEYQVVTHFIVIISETGNDKKTR